MAAAQLMLPANRAFDSNGFPEAGATVKLYQSGTTTPANFYADEGLTTPLGSELETNAAGRLVTPAYQDSSIAFRLKVFDADGNELDDLDPYYFGTLYGAVGPQGPAGDVAKAADRAALAAISGATANMTRYLAESGREGDFVFDSSDLSAKVAVDTAQGNFVAPSTDPTGASGAWVRKHSVETWYNVRHFGAVGDDVTDDYAAIQCCLNVAKLTGGTVWFPVGNYRINTGLALSLTEDGSLNIRIQGTPGSWLRTSAAIDCLTVSNTGSAANTRRLHIDGLAFLVDHVSARGLVLTKAAYNQFSNLEFLGIGTGIVCGSVGDSGTIHNQFTNIHPQQVGQGIYLSGYYNVVTNFTCGEGISGQYAIKIDGTGNIVDGFVTRGLGGAGGLATVEVTGNGTGSVIANGYVFDSYAVGVHVGGARHVKVDNVTIVSSQTHGLQLSGALQGSFNVSIQNSSQAAADVSHNINLTNTPTDNTVIAQFVGTSASKDINEANGTNNIFMCGTLPNGKTISGTGTRVISEGIVLPNIQTVTSNATVTPTFANDEVVITAQAAGLTLANPTGTSTQGKVMRIRIKDNGTARAISYGTLYRAVGVTLPTTTVISKTLYLTCVYNFNDNKWDVINVAQEA